MLLNNEHEANPGALTLHALQTITASTSQAL